MNTVSFGGSTWDFLHASAWFFPNEILSVKDSITAIRFCTYIPFVLPCRYCRESGSIFQTELGLLDRLTYNLKGTRLVTRSRIAKYWYDFHNRVNQKLGYPRFGADWEDSVHQRPFGMNDMFVFLFAICWNYPEREPSPDIVFKCTSFFNVVFPAMVEFTDVGKRVVSYVQSNPLTADTTSRRTSMTEWIYEMRRACDEEMGTTCSFSDTYITMEAFRARSSVCTVDYAKTAQQLKKEAKENVGCV